jgi:hypothetical protein
MVVPKSVLVGDRVRWKSLAGLLEGNVSSVDLDLNAAGDMINWITVNFKVSYNWDTHDAYARIPETMFEQLQFEVIDRNMELAA